MQDQADQFEGQGPGQVWKHFQALTQIPRRSGEEQGVRDYLRAFARTHGFVFETNEAGDVLLRVHPEKSGNVIGLQTHMDMVTVAAEGKHIDFARDPIQLIRDGDLVHADRTSLGADDGIGMSLALALAEQSQGPLELLFTSREETDFGGVEGVAPGWLKSRAVINVDSEEEGILTVASAGSEDFTLSLDLQKTPVAADTARFELKLGGLRGGHSGVDIEKHRANALKLLPELLSQVQDMNGAVVEVRGGSARNAIPASAGATIALPPDRVTALRQSFKILEAKLRAQTGEAALTIALEPSQSSADEALSPTSLEQVISTLRTLPSGVLEVTGPQKDQPRLSTNLGLVSQRGSRLDVISMSRSALESDLDAMGARYRQLASQLGARATEGNIVSGWSPNYDSALLEVFTRKYHELTGRQATTLEVHAGLEAGALKEKYPGLDVISVGPDVTSPHSAQEAVSISSTARTFALLQTVLQELQARPA